MKNKELEIFLQKQIPLVKLLGAKIQRVDDQAAEIFAPLKLNRNHLGTAFGGSLNAFAVIACYAWLYNFLNEQNLSGQILLKSSEIEYNKPVEKDFFAVCKAPDEKALAKFLKVIGKKKQARIYLKAQIGSACEFTGEFVVQSTAKFSLA